MKPCGTSQSAASENVSHETCASDGGAKGAKGELSAKHARHSWGAPVRFPYKTERSCTKCDVVKVTRHEPGQIPWIEFWRDAERIETAKTPPCERSNAPLPDPPPLAGEGSERREREGAR